MFAIGVIIGAIILMNFGINRSLNVRDFRKDLARIQSARLPQAKARPVRRKAQVSTDAEVPEIDGAAFISMDDRTTTSWDIQMEQLLGHVEVQHAIEQAGTFRPASQADEEYTKKMKWLDVRIREMERLARTKPDRDQNTQQLQNLYMLRASLQSVRDLVIK